MAKRSATERPRLDADAMHSLLKLRYPAERFALFAEVRNRAGFEANRSADAVCVALWPSDGLRITGFEVKVSRGDWQPERVKPEKAEAIAGYCDYWYLVAEQGVVLDLSEVPERWGLLVPTEKGDKLMVQRAPTLNADPKALDRHFLAAMLKRAQNSEATRTQIKEAEKKGREGMVYQLNQAKKDVERLEGKIAAFETSSGISLSANWDAGELGEVVVAVMHARRAARYEWQKHLRTAENAVKVIQELCAVIESIGAPAEDKAVA